MAHPQLSNPSSLNHIPGSLALSHISHTLEVRACVCQIGAGLLVFGSPAPQFACPIPSWAPCAIPSLHRGASKEVSYYSPKVKPSVFTNTMYCYQVPLLLLPFPSLSLLSLFCVTFLSRLFCFPVSTVSLPTLTIPSPSVSCRGGSALVLCPARHRHRSVRQLRVDPALHSPGLTSRRASQPLLVTGAPEDDHHAMPHEDNGHAKLREDDGHVTPHEDDGHAGPGTPRASSLSPPPGGTRSSMLLSVHLGVSPSPQQTDGRHTGPQSRAHARTGCFLFCHLPHRPQDSHTLS
jgi:hypothetical protein